MASAAKILAVTSLKFFKFLKGEFRLWIVSMRPSALEFEV
jgi:hypothetical protein